MPLLNALTWPHVMATTKPPKNANYTLAFPSRWHYWSPPKSTKTNDLDPSSRTTTRSTIRKIWEGLPPPPCSASLLPRREAANARRIVAWNASDLICALSVCTIHHHVLHWGVGRFLLLIPSILSFHSFGFYHVFVLISHSFVEDHAVSRFQEACVSLKYVCSCGFRVRPCRFSRSRNLCESLRFWLFFWGFKLRKI